MWIVVVEEERGEAQRDVLLRRGTEGRTQQLHSSYRDKESPATGGFGGGDKKTKSVTRANIWLQLHGKKRNEKFNARCKCLPLCAV